MMTEDGNGAGARAIELVMLRWIVLVTSLGEGGWWGVGTPLHKLEGSEVRFRFWPIWSEIGCALHFRMELVWIFDRKTVFKVFKKRAGEEPTKNLGSTFLPGQTRRKVLPRFENSSARLVRLRGKMSLKLNIDNNDDIKLFSTLIIPFCFTSFSWTKPEPARSWEFPGYFAVNAMPWAT